MATPKYDKEAHAASLIKILSGLGYTVTKGEPASSKAKTTTPLVSQRVGKANVPPMAKSSGGPIRTPADRIAAGSAPGKTPARYEPFPNRGQSRPPVGPPGSIGAQSRAIAPTSWPNGAPRQMGPLNRLPVGPPGSIGAGRPPMQGQGFGGAEMMGDPALSPMQGGMMPDMSVPPVDMMNRITGEEQRPWNPMALWSMLLGR